MNEKPAARKPYIKITLTVLYLLYIALASAALHSHNDLIISLIAFVVLGMPVWLYWLGFRKWGNGYILRGIRHLVRGRD